MVKKLNYLHTCWQRLSPTVRHGVAFLSAGAMGFGTDSAILLALENFYGLSPFVARIFSILGAAVVAWFAHRSLSFGVKTKPTFAEFFQFLCLGSGTSLLNYLVFSWLLWAGWVGKSFLAVSISSLVAMVFSYLGMRFGVFRKTHSVGR